MAGLYVHIPWCIRKCPYCDFNSHELKSSIDEDSYVDRLISDFELEQQQHPLVIDTVYFGGGTPSLFKPKSFFRFLKTCGLLDCAEITMEANPGTTESREFKHYQEAGISRLSLGIQSFNHKHLHILGRIHDASEATLAATKVAQAGFDSFNLDLMYGLPHQTIEQALDDLKRAIDLTPNHISWYQLTIEPNTVFAKSPPPIASTDFLAEMESEGVSLLSSAGYERYEISAFSRDSTPCRHNVNYWTFGDYLGIGAGAHSKITKSDGIVRMRRPRMPDSYVKGVVPKTETVADSELPAEFMMNALRLVDGVEEESFEQQTGLNLSAIQDTLDRLRDWNLMSPQRLQLTHHGLRQLDGIVAQFLN